MNELLNTLFGLGNDALGFGSPDAQVSFVHPLESWIFMTAFMVIAGGVWWSYRSVPGRAPWRLILGIARFLIVSILFTFALGPMIEQTKVHTEQDWAMVLIDRSSSLDTRDVSSAGPTSPFISREEQLMNMLGDTDDRWDALAENKRVVWMGFDSGASTIHIGPPPEVDALASANGHQTNINAAIEQALIESAARPMSAIVVISDGRSLDQIDPELIHTLESARIPVFTVPLGRSDPMPDLGISSVEFPKAAFADDLIPIRVMLSASGIIDSKTLVDSFGQDLRLELIDHTTGELLDSTRIESSHLGLDDASGQTNPSPLILNHTPNQAGEHGYDLVIRSEASAGAPVDLNSTNDQSSISLSVVDRPMRVLYIDGYPRWEHRYLKNLLLREQSIVSSSLLLSSSRSYMQEGDEIISAIPSSLEQWEPIDVIIIGDVRPQLFSEQQLETMLEHITKHGAGVLWIAGQSSTPNSWLDTPLGALLPMSQAKDGSQLGAWGSPITMRSTDEANRLGLLGLNDERTGWLDRLSEPSTGWSNLQWAYDLKQTNLKLGVSVLAVAQSISDTSTQSPGSPLVTLLRYGSGKSIFVGTDEIWRWRYGRGEDLPERFWLPIIRSLGRGTIDRRAASASLTLSPSTPQPGVPTQITLHLFDQTHIDTLPDELTVELRSASSNQDPSAVTLRGTGDTRTGTWIPRFQGIYNASLQGMDHQLSQISATARVILEADESRILDTDHAFLEKLATDTGGAMIDPVDFSTIPAMMPNRTRTIALPPEQASLWDRPIVLILLVLLLTIEWIGRRLMRLA